MTRGLRFLWALSLLSASAAAGRGDAGPWLRVNQVGYLPDDPKIAILSSATPLRGEFSVGDFRADIGLDLGAWGPFAHNYRLDFSGVRGPGRYRVQFGDVRSPEFAIGPDAYGDVPGKLLDFLRLQRCGENPVTGEKCHQADGIDTVTGQRVDVRGGWHDAGDRLKHMITTTYCVAALLLADRFAAAKQEGLYGADLVRRLHPDPDTIYVQIGDDRDHLPPNTLWHDDQSDYGWGKGGPRPAWRATGKPEGPKYKNESTGLANLAGRAAAAMALAGDIETARSMYKLAVANPGVAMSVPVRAPYYYGESSYHDDLAWAAAELYFATGEQEYLEQAIQAADAAGVSPWMGKDRHGHYEFFPYVYLGQWRLHQALSQLLARSDVGTSADSQQAGQQRLDPETIAAARERLAGYYRTGLERVRERAVTNPYRLGTPLVWCSTNDVIAFATQAQLYEQMTGDKQFRTLAAEARDWIFGRNPWGVSMVIGVPRNDPATGGRSSSRPHHLFYKLIEHLPVGGLVDGPVYKDINDSLKFDDWGVDEFARFQSEQGGVYHDAFADFSTNEPIIDGTASLLLLLHVWR